MSTNGKNDKPFDFRFVESESDVHLELMNATDHTLKSVEVLTVFLKDEETPGGGPSQVHIKFEAVNSIPPQQTAVVAHRTWINGRPVDIARDQLARLKIIAGEANPYVLDISWQDAEGKTRFQRIPVGH
jgi:hypothetical protein